MKSCGVTAVIALIIAVLMNWGCSNTPTSSEGKVMAEEYYHNKLFVSEIPGNAKSEAFVFFHGFPAERGKNEDLVEAVAKATGQDAYLIHYEGLGKSQGDFSFLRSIEASKEFLRDLFKKRGYTRVNLVGHSWGGAVAINLKHDFGEKIGQLILMSPFTNIPDAKTARLIFAQIAEEYPHLAAKWDVDVFAEELQVIRRDFHPWKIAEKLRDKAGDIAVIQALRDVESKPEDTQHFVEILSGSKYIELDQEHSFDDRNLLIKTVLSCLKERSENNDD